jgi:poly-gamma-glutamate capsule biosynthesis protein CapA/YwtB (metallophosphatase superfamily)
MSAQRARIAARAYDLWERRGRPEGSPEVDWVMAEQQILGDANDPVQPKVTFDSLLQEIPDVVTSASDKGPTASNTEATLPDEIPKRSRPARNAARQGRDNGATRK